LNIQRFDHVHSITFGSRSRSESILGVEFVVRREPERALENAKIVAGYIVVFMSLRVIRYAVRK
jgi:hypothetical protein